MQENKNVVSTTSKNGQINLREVIIRYSYHWKLFFLSIGIALISAFLYLQFTTYEYQVSSTILINDEENGGGSTSEISAFEDLGLFEGAKTSLDTEIGILKSKTLIERVVKELKLNITHYTKNGIGYKEIYQNQRPFNINLLVDDAKLQQLDTLFSISAKSNAKYDLFDSDDNFISEGSFGESVDSNFGKIIATPVSIDDIQLNQKILIKVSPVEDVSIELKRRIEVSPDNLNSNLLILKLQDPIRLKAKDILDNLVTYYNKDAVEFKSQIAKNTNEFLGNRIADISVELEKSDQDVQSYKTRNNLSNLDSEASLVLASNAELANRIVELNSQIKLIDYVTEYMATNTDKLIPANLGLLNENTSQNTVNYNNLVLERNRLATSAGEGNPVITNLSNQIASLRESIDRSLVNTKSSLKISLTEAKLQEIEFASKISSNPRKEREIRDIQRQQDIYETLYLYLLQKREENSISLAVTAPNARIVDKAYGNKNPVAPRKIVILLGSLLIGFLAPISLLTVKSLLDNKIHTHEDLEDVDQTPIIGDIPTTKSEKELITFYGDKSNVAESFRLLRTNVNYFLSNVDKEARSSQKRDLQQAIEMLEIPTSNEPILEPYFDKANIAKDFEVNQMSSKAASTISVTSTIRGEGKTFVAINLAISLALLNKRVLLIEANLRNPKIVNYLDKKEERGLSHLLVDMNLEISDVITRHDKTNVDILEAGSIPPNPAELLASSRFDEILNTCKQNYDYVIIDTPAVNIAADTLLFGRHADLFIYVIRANFLSKKLLSIPKNILENKRLPNMAVLMNGTDYAKRGYGSEYSFGDEEINKSWFKKLLG